MKYITVKESHYQTDLVVLKSRLESEGIECRFKNELTTQVLNHIPSFLVELQVSENDFKRAEEIMVEIGDIPATDYQIVCAKCGSKHVKLKIGFFKKVGLFFSILYAFTSNVPLDKIFRKAKYVCKDCGEFIEG